MENSDTESLTDSDGRSSTKLPEIKSPGVESFKHKRNSSMGSGLNLQGKLELKLNDDLKDKMIQAQKDI